MPSNNLPRLFALKGIQNGSTYGRNHALLQVKSSRLRKVSFVSLYNAAPDYLCYDICKLAKQENLKWQTVPRLALYIYPLTQLFSFFLTSLSIILIVSTSVSVLLHTHQSKNLLSHFPTSSRTQEHQSTHTYSMCHLFQYRYKGGHLGMPYQQSTCDYAKRHRPYPCPYARVKRCVSEVKTGMKAIPKTDTHAGDITALDAVNVLTREGTAIQGQLYCTGSSSRRRAMSVCCATS